jgi:hypothetical protein
MPGSLPEGPTLAGLLAGSLLLLVSQAGSAAPRMNCVAANGARVVVVVDRQLDDVAVAMMANGKPIIAVNPPVLQRLRPQTQAFFYAHECAHHVLGHTLGTNHGLAQEREADCWAMNALVTVGMFAAADVEVVQRDVARFGKKDWAHIAGVERALQFDKCLNRRGRNRVAPAKSRP